MKLEDVLDLVAYNVCIILRDGLTGELKAVALANTIKTDERCEDFMQWDCFQIEPVNTNTLKIIITN